VEAVAIEDHHNGVGNQHFVVDHKNALHGQGVRAGGVGFHGRDRNCLQRVAGEKNVVHRALGVRYEVEQIILNNLQVCQTESEHRFAT
jgi:hypothetical protein